MTSNELSARQREQVLRKAKPELIIETNRRLTRAIVREAATSKRVRKIGMQPAPGHTCGGRLAGVGSCKKCQTRPTTKIPQYTPPKLGEPHTCNRPGMGPDVGDCKQCAERARKWKPPALPMYQPVAWEGKSLEDARRVS